MTTPIHLQDCSMREVADRRLSHSFDSLSLLYEQTIDKLSAENEKLLKEQQGLEQRLQLLTQDLEKEKIKEASLRVVINPLESKLQARNDHLINTQREENRYESCYNKKCAWLAEQERKHREEHFRSMNPRQRDRNSEGA